MSADSPLTLDDFSGVPLEEWRRSVKERLDGEDSEALNRRTPDGVELHALYTAADVSEPPPPVDIARGAGGGWSVCSLIDAGEPVEIASVMADSLVNGADALWLRFDRAARLGLEADLPEARPHLGEAGVPLYHGADLETVFRGVALGGASLTGKALWLDAGGNALPATALCLASLASCDVRIDETVLHCGADPLATLVRDGCLPRDLMKLESEMAILARFSRQHLPGGRAITVSTDPYNNGGAGVADELAYATATLVAYLRALERSGLDVAEGAAEIALRFAVGSDLFAELAKLRAARHLWAMVLQACGVEAVPRAKIHAVGSWRTLSRRDPWNNLLRATGQSFAAVCGGADALSLYGYDRALGPSDARARRLATTTQLVLAEESRLSRVSDPTRGSYCAESLTRQLVERAWEGLQEIERRGGMAECLLSGWIGEQIERAAEARAGSVANGERPITGVSEYALEQEQPLERPSPGAAALASAAAARLERHRTTRAGSGTTGETAYSRHFVVDELVSAATTGATLSELAGRLGDNEGAETLRTWATRRDAQPFERDFGEGD